MDNDFTNINELKNRCYFMPRLIQRNGDMLPAGTIIWNASATVPAGYLLCNGAAVGRETYPDLFAAIGTTYGTGNGTSTFNLPNLINKFIEGSDTVGIEHEAGLPNITASYPGDWGMGRFNSGTVSLPQQNGAFKITGVDPKMGIQGGSNNSRSVITGFEMDASGSNPIYGNSTTVQLQSIKVFTYMVI